MSRIVAVVVVTLALVAAGFVAQPAAQAASGPVVSLGSVTAVEGHTPLIANSAKVPITLSQAQLTDVLVTWTVSGGTATAGSDYKEIKKPKTVKIAAGKVRAFASVALYGDTAVEGTETVQLTITNVVGATIGTASNAITIVEDPPGGPAVAIGSVTAAEGDTPAVAGAVKVPITLSQALGLDVLVTWSVSGGTATAADDYKAITKPKTTKIKAGKTTGYATVALYGDTTGEPDETVAVTISGVVGATLSVATGTVTIVDDDGAAPRLSNLWTWGANSSGQLGDGTNVDQSQPEVVGIGVPTTFTDLSAGFAHTCALTLDQAIWCSGDNFWGELGDGTTTNTVHLTPLLSAANWRSVSAGGGHTCAVREDETAWCWGRNDESQLGDDSTVEEHQPIQVGSDLWSWVVAGKGLNTCGIKTNGSLWCWGDNAQGQLGDGTNQDRTVPEPVALDGRWLAVSPGLYHTCGLRQDDNDPTAVGLWCWGYNGSGQLGDGTTTTHNVPTQVGTDIDWAQISGGAYHTCAMKVSGTMWCWGANPSGAIGDGTTTDRLVPTQVGTATDWVNVAAGASYSCGVRYDGTLWCWGWNAFGQLGDATFDDRLTPVQTSGTSNMLRVSANLHTVGLQA